MVEKSRRSAKPDLARVLIDLTDEELSLILSGVTGCFETVVEGIIVSIFVRAKGDQP